MERLEGHAAFRAVLAATYRRPMVAGMGVGDIHFSIAARVADAVPVFRITRPAEAQSLDAVVDTILETP